MAVVSLLAETRSVGFCCFVGGHRNRNFQMCFVTLSKRRENTIMKCLACGPFDLSRQVCQRVQICAAFLSGWGCWFAGSSLVGNWRLCVCVWLCVVLLCSL